MADSLLGCIPSWSAMDVDGEDKLLAVEKACACPILAAAATEKASAQSKAAVAAPAGGDKDEQKTSDGERPSTPPSGGALSDEERGSSKVRASLREWYIECANDPPPPDALLQRALAKVKEGALTTKDAPQIEHAGMCVRALSFSRSLLHRGSCVLFARFSSMIPLFFSPPRPGPRRTAPHHAF